MDLQMNGKTALVTGASAGIGKAIAFALAREGVDVAICARRMEPLEAAASQIVRETNRQIVARWSSRVPDRGALGAVIAAQIHGLCALSEARVADHAEAGAGEVLRLL